MTDKEKIKQEIERLYNLYELAKDYQRMGTCSTILDFINSLPEESGCEVNCTTKSEDLEEEISNYIKNNFFGSGSIGFLSNRTKEELDSIDVANIARHFAEWQRKQMKETLQTEYEKGRFDMREEMMKNTVIETKVMMDCDGDGIETPYEEWLTLEDTEIPSLPDSLGLKDGDKVKLIIVKEKNNE